MEKLRAGPSSWPHASWRGPVYAEDAAPGDDLRQSGARFDKVEIDTTWYRIQQPLRGHAPGTSSC